MSRSSGVFPAVRTEGGLLPADLLARIAADDKELEGLAPDDYHLVQGERLHEVIIRSWNRLVAAWSGFRSAVAKLPPGDAGTSVTRERWLLILFQELGYGRLAAAHGVEIEGKSYPISHLWQKVPIHLVGAGVDLDRRTAGVAGAARTSPHGLVQEYLNRSKDHLWGFVSNGLRLRVLRDNASLTRQAYVEFDLEAMMEGQAYADFVLLWLVCHESRVEAERPEDCWLERWMRFAREQGTRALDNLRAGVEQAITALGRGFLAHPGNTDLLRRLRAGELSTQDYYRQLLRLVYRLIFLFVAEDRGLLLDPHAPAPARQRYLRYYAASRLRRLAEHVRGTRHPDLYRSLRVVMDRLGSDTGCPELGLPALGSFLWSRAAISDLSEADIANCDFLEAIRALSFAVQDRVRRVVDYKNLGSEELGSIYESLLELHPEVNADAATFELKVASGHERKTTGSYYTPSSLIQSLLDSALDPVLDEVVRSAGTVRSGEGAARAQGGAVKAVGETARTSEGLAKTPEEAILSIKVCDPACGSGHFLIAAAHRIARRLAQIRTGDEEPSPEATRSALRDVIGHCIYGVDMNPMAVELCKVSLWMEALEPGKPLSFLDHRIMCGNSLLSTTPALLAKGIPDAAFCPAPGDDKKLAAALRRQNEEERKGQASFLLDTDVSPVKSHEALAEAMAWLNSIPDDFIAGVHKKEESYRHLDQSLEYQRARLAADAWCAAFVWKKVLSGPPPVTHDVLRRLQREDCLSIPQTMREEIDRLSRQYRFFHWHLAFPDVFRVPADGSAENEESGWSGGFDVVLGNPPWEKLTVSDEEWFASRDPEIAQTKGKSRRDKLISELAEKDAPLFHSYMEAKRDQEVLSNLLSREAGTFPLTGFKELNTYHLFAELAERLIAPRGRVGIIVKTGIGSAENCLPLFKLLTERRQLVSLFDFVNRKPLFPSVQTVERFSLLTLTGRAGHSEPIRFATLCQDVADLNEPGRQYSLSSEDIALMSPLNGACPLLKSGRDAEIMRRIYRPFPVLGEIRQDAAEDSWNVQYVRIFDMATDSKYFKRLEEMEAQGLRVDPDRRVRNSNDEYWPLYEGKYIYLLDHRYGSFETVSPSGKYGRKANAPTPAVEQLRDPSYEIMPRYWFPRSLWLERARQKGLRTDFLFLFRDVAGAYPDLRTAIGAICPAGPAGHEAPTLTPICSGDAAANARRLLAFAGLFCSIVLDYIVRNKLYSKHISLGILNQIPMPPPHMVVPDEGECDTPRAALVVAALELSYTSYSLKALGDALGIPAPFVWDADRRFRLLREIDALSAYFYGLSREEFEYVLSTFETLRNEEVRVFGQYRTARVALDAFDHIHETVSRGVPYYPAIDPLPEDLALTHSPHTVGVPASLADVNGTHVPRPFRSVEPSDEQKYRSCVPLYTLKAAAGPFGDAQAVEPDGWAELYVPRKLRPGMFVAQVVGHSMEPFIPDGVWCLFAAPVTGSRQGRIVLVQHRDIHDPETGGSYTVKRYRSQKTLFGDRMASDEGTWHHSVIYLEPLNPDYQPIVLKDVGEGEVRVIAELVEVLGNAGTFTGL